MRGVMRGAALALCLGACVGAPPPQRQVVEPAPPPPTLPDTTGWGVPVLALHRVADGSLWAGTNGHGIFVLRRGATEWERIRAGGRASIAADQVNSIASAGDSSIWYGTPGSGFGVSTDGGRSWRTWGGDAGGASWQYVAHHGIVARGDTIFVATADGLRLSGDGGETWLCVQSRGQAGTPAAASADGCTERVAGLPTQYLLSLDVTPSGVIWVGHLTGLSRSADGGRSWTDVELRGIAGERVRSIRVAADTNVWVATERALFVSPARQGGFREVPIRIPGYAGLPGAPRSMGVSPGVLPPLIGTSDGMLAQLGTGEFRLYYLGAAERYRPAGDIWAPVWWGPPMAPLSGSASGLNRALAGETPLQLFPGTATAHPQSGRHLWFQAPIADDAGNPYADGSRLYGSTGGDAPARQGIAYNNPAGTPVRAIGAGTVVFAGQVEGGSRAVAIRHDQQWEDRPVVSVYRHNTALVVDSGQRVQAGAVIARSGSAGPDAPAGLQLEVHLSAGSDTAPAPAALVAGQADTQVNPQLWITPREGTGIVAGVVFNGAGEPVPGTRIHGLVLAYPVETPFAFAETYAAPARGSPAYGEHFAVGDVTAGDYTLGVMIDGQRVWRRIRVAAGQVTWVEFRP